MAIFTIGTPDGRKLRIEAADEATAIRGAQEWTAANPAQAPAPTTGPATPPAGLKPGTREYADWAAAEAQAGRGRDLPQVSNPEFTETKSSVLDPLVQGMTFGWGDELAAGMYGAKAAMQGGDFGGNYAQAKDHFDNSLSHERRVNPVGSFAAEMAGAIPTGMLAGGGLAGTGATLGARALSGLAVGAAQGATYGAGSANGGLEDRATGGAVGGLVGGVAGAAAPYIGAAARRLLSPAPASATQTAAARAMAEEGITLSAGQATGNKGMQYLESELGKGAAADLMERQSEEFTEAVLRRIGVQANRATPEVVEGAYRAIGQQFDNLAMVTNTPFDTTLQNNLLNVAADYVSNAGTPAPVVENMVNRISQLAQQNGGRLTGQAYQEMRSTIGRLAQAAEPTTRMALRELQEALDDGVERHLNGQTLQAWQAARRAYQNFLVVEKAVTSAGEKAAAGLITPAQLRTAAVNQNRRAFAFGTNDYANLARAGIQTMTPLPQSGTAPRLAAAAMGSLPAAMGAAMGSPAGVPGMIAGGMAGAAIPRLVGGAMLSPPGRALLSNQLFAGPQAGIVERSIRSAAPLIGAGAAQLPLPGR